jgi:hypothetical protein
MYGGFWKSIISVLQQRDLPLGQSDMFLPRLLLKDILPFRWERCLTSVFGEEWYGRISGGTRVLEMAVDSRKAAPRNGAR